MKVFYLDVGVEPQGVVRSAKDRLLPSQVLQTSLPKNNRKPFITTASDNKFLQIMNFMIALMGALKWIKNKIHVSWI